MVEQPLQQHNTEGSTVSSAPAPNGFEQQIAVLEAKADQATSVKEAASYYEMIAQIRRQQTDALVEEVRFQAAEERLRRPQFSEERRSVGVSVFAFLAVAFSVCSVGGMVWALTKQPASPAPAASNIGYAVLAGALSILLYIFFPQAIAYLALSANRPATYRSEKKTRSPQAFPHL